MLMTTTEHAMRTHEFRLVLGGVADLSDDVLNALFEAGCDDATPCLRVGRVYLSFDREAPSFRAAVLSAISDVHRAGIGATVTAIDDANFVSQADIARRIDRTRQQVGQYVSGTRGPGGFPAPISHLSEGHPLWDWCEVSDWLCRNGIVGDDIREASRVVKAVNSVLEFQQEQRKDAALVEAVLQTLSAAPSPQIG